MTQSLPTLEMKSLDVPTPEGDVFAEAVRRLKEAAIQMQASPLWQEIVQPRDVVLARFQPIFAIAHLPDLTEGEFSPFLYFDQNHHWTGLHRQVNRICGDMPLLRRSLATLLDEKRPIADRLDEVAEAVHGMGKAIITAILTVAYPGRYGVWNATSEAALVNLQLFPEFRRGTTFGEKYAHINEVLGRLANASGLDLWTLDAIFWHMSQVNEANDGRVREAAKSFVASTPEASGMGFGLERHLHDFLFHNWRHTQLAADWNIYSEKGSPEAGYEYPCPIGRIDLLARHKTEKKWLVIELKRDNSSDVAVGQVLRYVGWVRHHLAEPDDEVFGLIIARSVDQQLQYAIEPVPGLRAMTYQVEFKLDDLPRVGGVAKP